jgi:hypothetical protein
MYEIWMEVLRLVNVEYIKTAKLQVMQSGISVYVLPYIREINPPEDLQQHNHLHCEMLNVFVPNSNGINFESD